MPYLCRPLRSCVLGAVVGLALLPPGYLAVRECLKFSDPVYTVDFEKPVSLCAAELAETGRIAWLGPYYAIHPQEYWFDAEDEFTYLYHFDAHVVQFYTAKQVPIVREFLKIASGDGDSTVYVGPEIIARLDDGDVLIVNTEPAGYVTKSVPPVVKPLVVQRVSVLQFSRSETEDGVNKFSSAKIPSARLAITSTPTGHTMRCFGLPPERYLLFADTGGAAMSFIGLGATTDGSLAGTLPFSVVPADTEIHRVLFYHYDSVRTFTVPTKPS